MRGWRLSRWLRLVRKAGTMLAVLLLPPLLMGAGMPSGHAPLPTAAGVHGAVVRLVDLVTGKQPPKAVVPRQSTWPTPGNQRQATASAGRNVARAEGYKPGQGKGQLPVYKFPTAKVKRHVTGPADPGTTASYRPATSTLIASGSTAASKLYKNADGSYTRLESPAAAGNGQVTFASLAGTGVKDTKVTSVGLRVDVTPAGGCPSTAIVSVGVSDAAGQNVGRSSGRLSASDCGGSASGGWVTVPLTGAGVKALSAKAGARLTVTASAASPAAPVAASPVASASPAGLLAPSGTVTVGDSVLAVTAAATLPQVNGQWPPDGYNSPTLTPELLASASDSDGGPLQYNFTLYNANGVAIDGTGWTSSNDITVPAGDMAWGQTYYWSVQAEEGTNTSPAPTMYAMSTPVQQPLVSSDLAQDGAGQGNGDSSTGPGYDAQSGNFTTEATDASVNVVGPPLSIQRTYNSLDASASGAFGAGWTSVLDMTIRPGQLNSSGSPTTEIITYPDGEQVAFGLNSSGAYTSPQGRYGTVVPNAGGGFQFVDKNDMTYVLSQSLGSNAYGLSSMYDGQDHTLNFTYTGNEITKIESAVSQRSLSITWSQPSGATYSHVATVATDDATAGNSSTAITWQYHYSGDQLTGACNESEANTPCTTYSYTAGSDYPAAVEDTGPASYWRLNETSGSVAASSVLANEGTDNGTYANPVFNYSSSPLAGEPSSVQVVGFNGTSSYVQVPASLAGDTSVASVSVWIYASGQTNEDLVSRSADPITGSSSPNPINPVMYIGNDGKLEAGFGGTTLSSTAVVNDSKVHNVVLTSTGSQETLYVDGKQVATKPATTSAFIEPYMYLGAGFLGGSYPDEGDQGSTPVATHFNGAMADVATWDQSLTTAQVAALYTAGTTPAALITKITRPSGKVFGQVSSYDPATSRVTSLTDSNGGSWTVHAPTMRGTSQVYTAAVKGGQPIDYWRLADSETSTAANQVNGGTATYNNVGEGTSGGPFEDSSVGAFNGTSSYLAMPNGLVSPDNESVSLWFKTTGTDEVLFSSSADSPANGNTSNGFTPNIYVGQDGKLNAEFDDDDSPLITSTPVNDNQWHNVVLTSDTTGDETLYVDGKQVQTVSGETLVGGTNEGQDQVFVGTGFLGSDWADQSHYSTANSTGYPSYFTGDIADFAVYPHEVSAGDVSAMWAAAQHSQGLSPIETATVTDPDNDQRTYQFDPLNSGRMLSYTDGLGNTTTYGYDSAGFQDQVIDPDGDFTDTGYDIRGNAVATTTCQNQATLKCGTSYATYSPTDTTNPLLAPWGSNDLIMTYQDPRSSSPSDTTYQTTYKYDGNGDLTSETTPPVPLSASGRTTNYLYTASGGTAGGYNGATPPPNLRYQVTDPRNEVTQTLYDANGDIGGTINANGVKTQYTYDGLGRKISQTVYSDTETQGVKTAYSYDADNRVVQETDPAFTDPITAPGSSGQVTHTPQITTNYDLDGDITSQVTADTTGGDASRTVSYAYTAYDQKQSYTDGAGNQTKYTSYDGYGKLLSETDAAGNVTNYTYDDDSRLKTTTLANYSGGVAGQTGSTITEDSRQYDPAGRLISDTDGTGRVTGYTYTDNGLTASVTGSAPGSGSYTEESDTYDAAGNLTAKVTDNGATTTDYAVDAGNQVTSQTVDPNGALDRVTSYTYDPDDNVTSQSVAQGSNSAIQSTSYAYDPMGDKTSETLTDSGAEGPAGWWTLAQPSGTTVTDSSGTGNQATAGGVTWTSGDGAQLSGQSGQDITTRGPVVDTTGSFSVSAWVELTGTTGNDEEVASQDAGSVAGFYLKYNSANGHWQFTRPEQDVSNPSTWATADSGAKAQTGTWTFLTGVYNAGTGAVQLYVNGNDVGTNGGADGTDSTPIASHGPVEIGAAKWDGQTGWGNFDGRLAAVEVYPTALSPGEVSNLEQQANPQVQNFGGDIARGNLTTGYAVDQLGQVTGQTDPDGATATFAYDPAGHQIKVTEPQVVTESSAGTPSVTSGTTRTGYDTFGDVAQAQDENGNITTYTYDGDGKQLSQTLPSYTPPGASGPINGKSTTTYTPLEQVKTQTDADNIETTYAYDQLGDQTSKEDNTTGATVGDTYYADGSLQKQTSPTGGQTTYTYDFLGRQVTSTQAERYLTPGSMTQSSPASYTTTTSYATATGDQSGTWPSSVTTPAPDNMTTRYQYDAAGEVTQSTDGAGNVTGYAYDALGRKVSTTNPDKTVDTVAYDPAGNVTAQTSLDTDGKTVLAATSATYDGEGDKVSATDANGNATTFTYDQRGDLTAETQPVTSSAGIVTSFGYDPTGDQTAYVDGNGNLWGTGYNSWNLPQTKVEPSTSAYSSQTDTTTTIAYNGDQEKTAVTEPGGVTQAYTYDTLGDLKSESGSAAAAATATRSFTYDNDSDMTAAATSNTAGSGSNATSETFTYDDRGLVTGATGSAGTTALGYNGDGQLSSAQTPAGTSSYAYDGDGRLATMADPASGQTLAYSYNPMSQVSKIIYGGSSTPDVQSYGYNGLHQLTSDTLSAGTSASPTLVASIDYQYDNDGNITQKATTNLGGTGTTTNTYTYDEASRLTSWNNGTATTGYAHDSDGNRTKAGETTYAYDARDELTGDGTSTYSYTADGDLSSAAGPSGTVASTSDAFGQQATQGSLADTYDALGRDVQLTSGSAATNLSYRGTSVQLTGDGGSDYTWTPAGTLTGTSTGGAGVLDLTDAHTDLVGQFTATGTSLSASRAYSPWGAVTARSANALAGSLGYQSQYASPVTGQTSMGARWYNPATGSFGNKDTVSNDPVPDSASASPFAYAGDNPLTGTDPTGHMVSPYSGPLTAAEQKQAAVIEKASIDATAANGAQEAATPVSQKAAAAAAPLDAHQLHLAHLAHLAATGQTPPKAAPAVTSPTLAQLHQDNDNRQLYDPTALIPCPALGFGPCMALTKQENQNLQDNLNPQDNPVTTPAANPAPKASSGGSGAWSWLKSAVKSTVKWVGDTTGVTNAINCAKSPSLSQCLQAVGKLGLTVVTIATAGGTSELEIFADGGEIATEEEGNGLADAAGSCLTGGKSFTAGTLVLLAGGKAVPIASLKAGDKVLASDTRTGKNQAETVTAVLVHHDTDLYDLKVRDHGKTSVIHTTASHLFWDPYLHHWVSANKLSKGEHLKTPDGTLATADGGITPKRHDGWMWDLTVPGNGDHDFYVLPAQAGSQYPYHVVTGGTPILVHNTNGCGTTTLYRTSPIERGSSELDNGLNAGHFPRTDDGSYDGAAHFGNEKTASEWAQGSVDTHGTGFKVEVPNEWLQGHISAGRIDVWEGMTEEHAEYSIPTELFDEFNSFPRSPWSGR